MTHGSIPGSPEQLLKEIYLQLFARIDDVLVDVMVLNSVLGFALVRLDASGHLQDMPEILSAAAKGQREAAAKVADAHARQMVNEVADGLAAFAEKLKDGSAFDRPAFTIIQGGRSSEIDREH